MRTWTGADVAVRPVSKPPFAMPTDAQAQAMVRPVDYASEAVDGSADIYLDQQVGDALMRTYLKAAAFFCCTDEKGEKWALGCLPVMIEHAAGERDVLLWRGCYPLAKIAANAKMQGVEVNDADLLESAYLRILTTFARTLEGSTNIVDIAPQGRASIPKLSNPMASAGMSTFEAVAKHFIDIFLPPQIADVAFDSAVEGATSNPKTQAKLKHAKKMYDRSDYTGLYHVFVSDKELLNAVKKGSAFASHHAREGIKSGTHVAVHAAVSNVAPAPDSAAGGFFDNILKTVGGPSMKALLDVLLPPGIADAAFDSAIQGITDNPMRQQQLHDAKAAYDRGDYAGVYHTFVSNKELLGLVQKGATAAAKGTRAIVAPVIPGAKPAEEEYSAEDYASAEALVPPVAPVVAPSTQPGAIMPTTAPMIKPVGTP